MIALAAERLCRCGHAEWDHNAAGGTECRVAVDQGSNGPDPEPPAYCGCGEYVEAAP